MRIIRPLAGAIALALGVAATGSAQAATLHFRLGEDPETLYNIATISQTAGDIINSYMLESLVYFDADGKPQPWLATGWDISADQTTITFKLRSGIVFQDGTLFNAAAVAATYGAILDPANASPQLANMGSLSKVESVDDMTVRFTYKTPFAPAFNAIAGIGINSPTAVAKYGKDYGRHPVGTGPFAFKEWIPGTSITLERNPSYHAQFRSDVANKGAPYADEVVLTVIAEEGVAQSALETGELTAAGLQADAITQFASNPQFKTIINKSNGNLVFLEFNQFKAPFGDAAFRKALGYAIDRKAAVDAAWGGYGAPALSLLSVAIPYYDAKVAETYGTPYDPAKARELLAADGWTDSDGDGTLDKGGQKAEFVIRSYSGFTHIDRTLQVVQSNFADIGIKVSLETSDWGAFYPSLLEDGWDMDLMRWTDSDADVLTQLFASPGHRKKLVPNPAIDDTLKRCSATLEPAARAACVSEAQKALLEDMTAIPILTSWGVTATQANVSGYHFDYLGYLLSADIKAE
ncbi:MAG: extracellular solute-binding protein family 5 [Proteobacteria bacterium]|nr:extracellular solute-binding protein family 5 [Pseudomonadota bacterium]